MKTSGEEQYLELHFSPVGFVCRAKSGYLRRGSTV